MIQIATIHHTPSDSQKKYLRSRHLTRDEATHVTLVIGSPSDSMTSIIEEFFMENIWDVSWTPDSLEDDFLYITEKYNQYSKSLWADKSTLDIFFGVVSWESFTFSLIGDIYIALKEKDKPWSLISDYQQIVSHEFSHNSTGNIPKNSTIYISSIDLTRVVDEDILGDLSRIRYEDFSHIGAAWCQKESLTECEIIRIQEKIWEHGQNQKEWSPHQHRWERIEKTRQTFGFYYQSFLQKVDTLFETRPQIVRIGILLAGVLLCIMFFYILFDKILNTSSGGSWGIEEKTQLIQAKEYLDTAQGNIGNPEIFEKNITSSEEILIALRGEELYTKDVQDMLSRISTLKKEMYDIQTFSLQDRTPIFQNTDNAMKILRVFHHNKKISLIGKDRVLIGYTHDTKAQDWIDYPLGEEAIDAEIMGDGTIYILTKIGHILIPGNEKKFETITTADADGWKWAKGITTYNGNLYLLNSDGKKIYRYKPGTGRNFWNATEVLDTPSIVGISDIGIDRGFFLLKEDGKIQRFITINGVGQSFPITINKIPGEYSITHHSNTTLIVRPNLKYFYILNGSRIWIFDPDSKNPDLIKSWSYIAQIDIEASMQAESISVPYDGSIIIASRDSVYDLSFEVADGKAIIR